MDPIAPGTQKLCALMTRQHPSQNGFGLEPKWLETKWLRERERERKRERKREGEKETERQRERERERERETEKEREGEREFTIASCIVVSSVTI